MKKKKIKLPPREAPFETYALADTQWITPWGTSVPPDDAVMRMRQWSEENQQ